MSEYFSEPTSLGGRVKVELDLSNYAAKEDLKNVTGVDTSNSAKKADLADLKSDVDKLDIDKLQNVPGNLRTLKNKVDKLDTDKLVLQRCRARDLFGSQIPVNTGGFELHISCIQSSYLTHEAIRPNSLG